MRFLGTALTEDTAKLQYCSINKCDRIGIIPCNKCKRLLTETHTREAYKKICRLQWKPQQDVEEVI